MNNTLCPSCKSSSTPSVVIEQFLHRACGHFVCRQCGCSYDSDVDTIGSAVLTLDEVSSADERGDYRRLFVESPRIENTEGVTYGRFDWADQEDMKAGVVARIVEALEINGFGQTPGKLLDLGCGNGFTSVKLADHYPKAEIIAIDPSPQITKIDGYVGRISAWRGTLQLLGDEVENVDAIVIIGNLMLHEDPFDTLARAVAKLNPGGVLIIDFKNIRSSARQLGIFAARTGLSSRLPRKNFERLFVNMRYGFNDDCIQKTAEKLDLKLVNRVSVSPRLLEFKNASSHQRGIQGLIWRTLNQIDKVRKQQAWIQHVYRKDID